MSSHALWKESILALLVSGSCFPNTSQDTNVESPEMYGAIVGSFRYRDETSIMYKGYECNQEMEVYPILNEMNLADYVKYVHDKDISKVRIYSLWEDINMDYNIDEAWILLGCLDTNWLTVWLYAEGVHGIDSYNYASCIYKTQLFECSGYENPNCL